MCNKTEKQRKRIFIKYVVAAIVSLIVCLSIASLSEVVRAAENDKSLIEHTMKEVSASEDDGASPKREHEKLLKSIVFVTTKLVCEGEDGPSEEVYSTGFFLSTKSEDVLVATYYNKDYLEKKEQEIKENREKSAEGDKRTDVKKEYFVTYGRYFVSAEPLEINDEETGILILRPKGIRKPKAELEAVQEEEEKVFKDGNFWVYGYSVDGGDEDNDSLWGAPVVDAEDFVIGMLKKSDVASDAEDNAESDAIEDEKVYVRKSLTWDVKDDDVVGSSINLTTHSDDAAYGVLLMRHVEELLDVQGIEVKKADTKRPTYVYVLVIIAVFLAFFTLERFLFDGINALLLRWRRAHNNHGMEKGMARLSRIRTGELIDIDKEQFFVGSDSRQCDYVVEDNETIEAVQFCILHEKRKFYLVNLGRYSETLLNDREAVWKRKIKIKNRMSIQAGNERFTFLT